jgi:hypothetical protein
MMLVVVVVIETAPPEHSGEVGTSEDHLKMKNYKYISNLGEYHLLTGVCCGPYNPSKWEAQF